MPDEFDPYQKWLGIPPQEQPPNYYRLLTLKPLEPDPGVIERTADKLTAYLEARSQGKNAAHAQRLLEEVAVARQCLLDSESKAAYDASLQTGRAKKPAAGQIPARQTASSGQQASGALDFLNEAPSAPVSPRPAAKPAARAAVSAERPAPAASGGDMSFLDDLSFSGASAPAKASPAVKSNSPATAKGRGAATPFASSAKKPGFGAATAGKKQGWQPQPWQLGAMIGGGVLFVVGAIAIVMSMQGNHDPVKPATNNVVKQAPADFGPQTVNRAQLDQELAAKRKIPYGRPSTSVSIRREGNFYLVPVTIDDQPAGDFLIDTGAAATALKKSLADRLHLDAGDKSQRIRAVGGGQMAEFRKTKSLNVGEAKFGALQIVVIDLAPWEKQVGAKFDGVLGCDVWRELMFCLDPGLLKLTFYDRDTKNPMSDSAQLLTVMDERPFVTVQVDGGEELRFMAATGSGAEILHMPAGAGQGGAAESSATSISLLGTKLDGLKAAKAKPDDVYVTSDPRQAGVVGGQVLGQFKIVMDFQRNRVAAKRITAGPPRK